jgi:hypothetical protein
MTAPVVAELMAEEMNYGRNWVKDQIDRYTRLAKEYHL